MKLGWSFQSPSLSLPLCLTPSVPLKDNLKAIYQRARAYSALYNEDKARQDFIRAVHLDPKLKPIVKQELKKLGENVRAKRVSENKNYWASSKVKWEQKAQDKKCKTKELLRQEALIKIMTNTLNNEHTRSLPLKEENVKPIDKEECSTTAKVGKENTDREASLETINQIKEDFHATSPIKAVRSTDAIQNTVDLKSTNPQMELMNTADI